jgi:hypothetical protein
VVAGDPGGDGETAAARRSSAAASDQPAYGLGQAGTRVADLDAHPSRDDTTADADRRASVFERVRHEVAAGLGEAERVGSDERSPPQRLDREQAAERRRQRRPGLGAVVEQRADVHELGATPRAVPAAGGHEIVERQRGATELEVDRGGVVDPVQSEPSRAQRPAQLVARVGDELRLPGEAEAGGREAAGRAEGEEPTGVGQRAHAASSNAGPSTSR